MKIGELYEFYDAHHPQSEWTGVLLQVLSVTSGEHVMVRIMSGPRKGLEGGCATSTMRALVCVNE